MSVRSVDFSSARARGTDAAAYQVAIELRGGTPGGDQTVRFHPRVLVRLELAFALDGGHQAFTSEAMLAGLEAGDRRTVYFYLPPELTEHYRLSREPTGWRVALAVDGQALPNLPGSYSDTLRNPAAARSFQALIAERAASNEGALQPIYLTPFYNEESGLLPGSPSYIRRDFPSTKAAPGP